MNINELIEINEIKKKTITDLINHPETEENQMDKLQACRRFISGFISELKQVKSATYYKPKNVPYVQSVLIEASNYFDKIKELMDKNPKAISIHSDSENVYFLSIDVDLIIETEG